MWPSRDIAWSTGPKNCSLFTLDLIAQSSLCIITNYIYSWSSSWWAAMQLLRRHQDSWLTMQWFRPCQPTIRGGRDRSTPDPFPPRPGSCRPWSEDSWSKTQFEVCGIPVGPKSGYFLFEPWDFICSFTCYFVYNYCDRRLRTFVKIPSEKFTTYMFKRRVGGGIKGFLNNVQKNCTFLTARLP